MSGLELLTVIFILAVLLDILSDSERLMGRYQGSAAAMHDVEGGHPGLRIGGRWTMGKRGFAQSLRDQYQLEVINAGCVPTAYGSGYSAARNEVVLDTYRKRGSRFDVDALWDEAELVAQKQ
jgi:hypothetical protein